MANIEYHQQEYDKLQCVYCSLELDFDLPLELIDAAHHRQLVLFVGAGVSTEASSVFPTTLYEDVCEDVKEQLSHQPNDDDFPSLMSVYEAAHGRVRLVQKIKQRLTYVDTFTSTANEAKKFHRELATMPYIEKIITTNWDPYFEEEAGATPFVTGEDFALYEIPGRQVYKIHGSITSLSTLVITQQDYERQLEALKGNALGGFLRQILATKTIIFIGYSLQDWDFRRLYEALLSDMGALRRRAYVVSPYASRDAKQLGLIQLQTSGIKFLRDLKAKMIGDCFLPDLIYDRVEMVREEVVRANSNAIKISPLMFPAVMHCWSYQDGLRDALTRTLIRRTTGEYSDVHYVEELARMYEEEYTEAIAAGSYWEAAYIEGYTNGLYVVLFGQESHPPDPPLYFSFGNNSTMRKFADLKSALKKAKRTCRKAWEEGRRLAAGFEEGIVAYHPPFLFDYCVSGADASRQASLRRWFNDQHSS